MTVIEFVEITNSISNFDILKISSEKYGIFFQNLLHVAMELVLKVCTFKKL